MMRREIKDASDFQALIWSVKIDNLDIQKDKEFFIQRVLARGSLKELCWLKKTYSPRTIKRVFIGHPQKQYTPSSLNFVNKYILKNKRKIQAKKYVKNIFLGHEAAEYLDRKMN